MTSSQHSAPSSPSSSDDDEDVLLSVAARRIPKKRRTSNSPPPAQPPQQFSRLKRPRAKKEQVPVDSPATKRTKSEPEPEPQPQPESDPIPAARSRAGGSGAAAKKVKRVKKEVKQSVSRVKKEKVKIELVVEKNGKDGKDKDGSSAYRWWDEGDEPDGDEKKIKWSTLSHNAVMFPPEYEPHHVPLLYNGKPVKLSAKAEEVASFYAQKLGTDYMKKDTFRKNFFEDFCQVIEGSEAGSIIKELEKCDFSRIEAHFEKKKQKRKDVPAAERKRLREEEAERCKKYTVAIVDGREEKVGNFRVEPPGLFLGRGEHPKMGRVKSRIYPEDITINIGEEAEIPACLVTGHKWGKIVHKRDVTWLCYWKDTITGGSKYVWLSAGSTFKGMSDHAKFEKARRLSQHIDRIRSDYREGFAARSKEVRQRSVAMYLIDKLALRVGNEKGEDEADTVGCCSLRVEHIKFFPPRKIQFDFLGKDSIRYFNEVEVREEVFNNLKLFCRGKNAEDEIFHRLSVTGLNEYLKSLMDGLSAKVFRTYNASHTLDRLLQSTPQDADMNEKIVHYNQQNKEVAILCNHQRALPKQHGAQMEKMDRRVAETEAWLQELRRGRNEIKKSKGKLETVELKQMVPQKPEFTAEMDEKARAAERKRAAEAPRVETTRVKKLSQVEAEIKRVNERLAKLKADRMVKDELKTVALGTSKINYLDPRITVAWCKKHEVPIEKIFAKTLLVKFAWAMETPEDFTF